MNEIPPSDEFIDSQFAAFEESFAAFEGSEVEQYQDFMNYVSLFDIASDELLLAIVDVLGTKTEESFQKAQKLLENVQDELCDSLKQLALYIFQPEIMHQEEAIQIWTTLVHNEIFSRMADFRAMSDKFDLHVPNREDIEKRARAYATGRAKLSTLPKTAESHDFRTYEGAEYIHELTDGELDWTNLSDVSEEDEYGAWVHDEYREELDKQVQAILALCRGPLAQ